MEKVCNECFSDFILEKVDLDFYAKIDVCIPKLCFSCRAQNRLSFRNEKNLYHNTCAKTGKSLVSIFSPNKPYTVYSYDAWFADDWDAVDYGKSYDIGRPFFEQLKELFDSVPKPALIHTRSINSEYLNLAADNKNAYMIFESSNNEDATNCYWVQRCKDVCDVSFSDSCELCINCDDCFNCYRISDSSNAQNCSESDFLVDCRGLTNCIGCVNLYGGEYFILNKKYSKEEYVAEKEKLMLHTYSGRQKFKKIFEEFLQTQPQKYAHIVNSINSSGNYLKNVKNCTYTFHAYDAEECRYAEHVWRNAKECVDVSTAGRNAELIYNALNAGLDVAHQIGTMTCWSSTYAYYSSYCFNSNNIFGCFGLRKKEYCILNKQYSKEEYFKLKEEIINQMKKNEEWGNWYPKNMSFFGYNESSAQDQFPLTQEEVHAKQYKWEESPRGTYSKETRTWDGLDNSESLNIKGEIFACVETKKNFRFVENELTLYKKLQYPLPRIHPDVRLEKRLKKRGLNNLYNRKTDDGSIVWTPIPQSDTRLILSEEEYKKRFL